MDLASIIGLILGVVMVVYGIVVDDGFGVLKNFYNLPSILITFGGSLASTLISNKLSDFINGFKGFLLAVQEPKNGNPDEVISNIIQLSNVSRKEGLLALEEATNDIEDEFLKKGINLVVDGTDPDLVRGIMETDLANIEMRHKKVVAFWEKWAEMGPAWGMIGTLIGLVNMLQNMSDANAIGPAMAVALLTTLYGSLIANWLCLPTAAKLNVNNSQEIMIKEITVEGLLSIQAGENPRVIEEKLKSFLAPSARDNLGRGEGGGEG